MYTNGGHVWLAPAIPDSSTCCGHLRARSKRLCRVRRKCDVIAEHLFEFGKHGLHGRKVALRCDRGARLEQDARVVGVDRCGRRQIVPRAQLVTRRGRVLREYMRVRSSTYIWRICLTDQGDQICAHLLDGIKQYLEVGILD